MKKEKLLTLHINCTDSIEIKGEKDTVRQILFDGYAEGEYFNGKILPGAVDTQTEGYEKSGVLSARYMLEGKDTTGNTCRLYIDNKGVIGEELTCPHIITDSKALAPVFRERLEGHIDRKNGELIIEIYKRALYEQAFNPYLPSWEYIPDGEPYVFGDRVYVYGSHDRYDGQTFCLNDYVCWSAPVNELNNWRYEGVIFKKDDDPFNKNGDMCLYAPDVTVGPDGRYYLYYVLDRVKYVSVAVCDTPAGKYEFLGYVHYPDGTLLGDREGDEPQFDPGVLTEGDITYLFTGFSGADQAERHGAMLSILDKDMLTVLKRKDFVVPGGYYAGGTEYENHAFFEASSIRKRGDKYYFIYSSQQGCELCYAISDRPDGEYRYGGVIVSNNDTGMEAPGKRADISVAYGGNNHGSIIEIENEWYIFYHRQTNNTWFSRQGCAERISFEPDGSIKQVEMTSCGLNNGPLSDKGIYPAYIACNLYTDKHYRMVGDDDGAPRIIQDGGDGDENEGYIFLIRKNVTIGYKYFDCKAVKGLRIWTRGYFDGDFEIRNSYSGEVLGKITVSNGNIWTAYEGTLDIPDGKNALFLTFTGTGQGCLKQFELLH